MPANKDSISDLRRNVVTVRYEESAVATPARHTLGRKPVGFVKVMQSVGMQISATEEDENKWTDEVIYTRSSATGTAKLEVL